MSVQFGRWNFEGQPPAPDYIDKVSATLAPYGPDSNQSYSDGGVTILYRAFHTTMESRRETQPHVSSSGAVITWDGRLDNRAELISELPDALTIRSTDIEIVAATYERWGTKCLAKFIGDWALSVWNPIERLLLLAKDPIGTRHLYYSIDHNQVTWSTILDPLVLFAGRTFRICDEYIAGWFVCFPAVHLTPYVAIDAVPPSSSVLLRPGKHTVSRFWDFDPHKRIRYRTDAEYEEHFRTVFAKAVRRRLRSDRPILAELSGGMDSSSIVCMADLVISSGDANAPRLDTISFYDDSNPNLDERPYFTKVEQKRGRTGYHIDLGAKKQIEKTGVDSKQLIESGRFVAIPDYYRYLSYELFEQYTPYIRSQQHRVTLSGIGGEDATGGFVPTPTPEFQNLLARGRFLTLARQLSMWAAKMRKPRIPLLWEAVRGFFRCPLTFPGAPTDVYLPSWCHKDFVRRNQAALHRYPSKVKLFSCLPSFQNHIHLLNHRRRCIASFNLWSDLLREIRYPYLDRDLLGFSYAIPQEQIVGVGKRRFLMKRALVGIVPDEILNRKQKAVVPQTMVKDIPTEWPSLAEIGHHTLSGSIGIIDPNPFLDALQKARLNEEVPIDSLKRTLFLEFWLRHLAVQGVLAISSTSSKRPSYSSLALYESSSARPAQKFS